MSARERRIVHMALREAKGVRTESTGEDPDRRIQIIPDKAVLKARGGGGRRVSDRVPEGEAAAVDRLLGNRAILEGLPGRILVVDPDDRILYVNRTMPGRSTADFVGTSVESHRRSRTTRRRFARPSTARGRLEKGSRSSSVPAPGRGGRRASRA